MQIKNPITLHIQSPRKLQQRLGFIGAWIQREETQQLFDEETRQDLYCSGVAFNKSHVMICISIELRLYHTRSVGLVSYVHTTTYSKQPTILTHKITKTVNCVSFTSMSRYMCFRIPWFVMYCGKHKFPLLRLKLIHKVLVGVKYYWVSATPRVVLYCCAVSFSSFSPLCFGSLWSDLR
jgi:hypothetical protein